MRNRNLIGFGIGLAAACYLLAERSQTNGIIGFYHETLSAPAFAVWLSCLIAVTISVPICAVFFWSMAKRFRHGWILHLSLLPAMYALIRASAALMLLAAGEPNLDSMTGHALLPAMLLFTICPIAYFVSLGVRKIVRRRRLLNGS